MSDHSASQPADAVAAPPTVGATARAPQPSRPDHVELFRGADRDWFWRRRAPNGEIVAIGGEGYADRADAVAAARRVNGDLTMTLVADPPDR